MKKNILKMMEHVNETFTSVTGHSISFVDFKGNNLLPLNMEIFSDFCKCVITSENGREKCFECNKIFDKHIENKAIIKQCHMGITMITVPIIINKSCSYQIICGQMILEGTKENVLKSLHKKAKEMNLDVSKLIEFTFKIKELSKKEIETRAMLLSMLAEYISITETQIILSKKYMVELENKIKLEKNLREIQYKFLQAQINPHFLFNTLNLIARSAQSENASITAEITYDLSELLRRCYKNKKSLCYLDEELSYIKNYLNIQKKRYLNNFHYEIICPDSIKNKSIPSFLIQPFVENSIIHGIEKVQRKGYIEVNIQSVINNLVIKIIDNGVGIKKNANKILEDSEGIGIKNVIQRLNYFYKNNYDFKINSEFMKGTEVQIILPLE